MQIHTHNAVLNRVRCPDGEWRSFDGRAIYRVAASAGALYDRVREAALERDLGVRHEQRKPGGPREIVGVDDDICRLFSSRRVQIEGRLAELVAACRDRAGGVEPSQWMIEPDEPVGHPGDPAAPRTGTESTAEALARWESRNPGPTGALPGRGVAAAPPSARHGGEPMIDTTAPTAERPSDDELVAAAVGGLDAEKSTWTRYDLARQLTRTCPWTVARRRTAAGPDRRLVDAALERGRRSLV